MPFTVAGRNLMLNALFGSPIGAPVAFASLHSDAPGESGDYEISGGSPAYARQPVAFAASTTGSVTISAPVTFDVPAGAQVAFVGLWTLAVGGSFLGYAPSNGGSIYGGAAVFAATDIFECPAHQLVDADRVLLTKLSGAPIPAPATEDALYYVTAATANTFKITTTPSGTALNITLDGRCAFQRVAIDAYSTQGTATLNSCAFSLEG